MSNPENKKPIDPDYPINPIPAEEQPKDKQHEQEVPNDPKEQTGNEDLYNGPRHEDKSEESRDIDRKEYETDN